MPRAAVTVCINHHWNLASPRRASWWPDQRHQRAQRLPVALRCSGIRVGRGSCAPASLRGRQHRQVPAPRVPLHPHCHLLPASSRYPHGLRRLHSLPMRFHQLRLPRRCRHYRAPKSNRHIAPGDGTPLRYRHFLPSHQRLRDRPHLGRRSLRCRPHRCSNHLPPLRAGRQSRTHFRHDRQALRLCLSRWPERASHPRRLPRHHPPHPCSPCPATRWCRSRSTERLARPHL